MSNTVWQVTKICIYLTTDMYVDIKTTTTTTYFYEQKENEHPPYSNFREIS